MISFRCCSIYSINRREDPRAPNSLRGVQLWFSPKEREASHIPEYFGVPWYGRVCWLGLDPQGTPSRTFVSPSQDTTDTMDTMDIMDTMNTDTMDTMDTTDTTDTMHIMVIMDT